MVAWAAATALWRAASWSSSAATFAWCFLSWLRSTMRSTLSWAASAAVASSSSLLRRARRAISASYSSSSICVASSARASSSSNRALAELLMRSSSAAWRFTSSAAAPRSRSMMPWRRAARSAAVSRASARSCSAASARSISIFKTPSKWDAAARCWLSADCARAAMRLAAALASAVRAASASARAAAYSSTLSLASVSSRSQTCPAGSPGTQVHAVRRSMAATRRAPTAPPRISVPGGAWGGAVRSVSVRSRLRASRTSMPALPQQTQRRLPMATRDEGCPAQRTRSTQEKAPLDCHLHTQPSSDAEST
mmetsp:Transcript_17059/g.49424  ORF Transcript_17059/g.49424 Transcript_17059/m.49424 type:complete len:310 (-) Transcript_17059:135-1064(-)